MHDALFFLGGAFLTVLLAVVVNGPRLLRALAFPFCNEYGLSLSRLLAAGLGAALVYLLFRRPDTFNNLRPTPAAFLTFLFALVYGDIIGGKVMAQRALEIFGGRPPVLPEFLTRHLASAPAGTPALVPPTDPLAADPPLSAAPDAPPAELPDGPDPEK